MKKLLSILLVVLLVCSTTLKTTNETENKNIVLTLNDKNFYIDENGVKTYYIKIMDILNELEKNGFNYKSKLSKEKLKKIEEQDKLLDRKKYSSKNFTYVNKYYIRIYINIKEFIGVASDFSNALSLSIPGTGKTIRIGVILASLISRFSSDIDCYIHNIQSSTFAGKSVSFGEKVNFSGWTKGSVVQIDEKNPEVEYNLATYWYYIEDGFAFVPVNLSSNWKKINNKWYEFNDYGELLEHSGWREYNGKWMYHIPGDFGAYLDKEVNIDGEWFEFDLDGYCIKGRGC